MSILASIPVPNSLHGARAFAWWPVVLVMMTATVTDLRSRRIPNWLVFPFMVAGLLLSSWEGGWAGVAQSLEGFALGAAVYGVFNWMGGMGMGDVKLCAAAGCWIGPGQQFSAMLFTALIGGLMAFGWALYRGFLGQLFTGSSELLFGFGKRGIAPHPELTLSNPETRKMPYAPAIAIGTLLSFFASR